MAQDLSLVQGITGNYLRYSTGEYSLLHGVMGILIRILGGIFQKALNIARLSHSSRSLPFSSGKTKFRNRQTLYRSSESQ